MPEKARKRIQGDINGHRRIRTADFLHVKQAYWSSLKRNVLKNNHYIMRPGKMSIFVSLKWIKNFLGWFLTSLGQTAWNCPPRDNREK